jgi:hypothetical protein
LVDGLGNQLNDKKQKKPPLHLRAAAAFLQIGPRAPQTKRRAGFPIPSLQSSSEWRDDFGKHGRADLFDLLPIVVFFLGETDLRVCLSFTHQA